MRKTTRWHLLRMMAFVTWLPFASCVINQNGFAQLSEEDRRHFYPFKSAETDKPVSYADSCSLQRITHKDLSLIKDKYSAIWVHVFAPWCKGPACENLGRYETMAASCGTGVKLVMLSLGYDRTHLNRTLYRSGINRMVYVLDTSYSKHYAKGLRTFFDGLNESMDYPSGGGDFILRNDTVVYLKHGGESDSSFLAALKQIGDGGAAPKQVW